MPRITRRTFFKRAVAAGTAFPLVTIASTKASGRVVGPNDTSRVGVAGIHGQGMSHINQYLGLNGVQITYLIDPDASLFQSRGQSIKQKWGRAPTCVQDICKALDAISIATPNHWHSLMTIWACQAGKDVYVEKPLSHNITEGRRWVEIRHQPGRQSC
jgi:predicted dehydrogenase